MEKLMYMFMIHHYEHVYTPVSNEVHYDSSDLVFKKADKNYNKWLRYNFQ